MFVDFGFCIQNLKQLVQRCSGTLHRVVQLRQLLHRVEEAGEQKRECNDRAQSDVAAMHQPAADADHERASEHAAKLDECEVPRTNAHAAFVALEKLTVRLGELFDRFFFLCVGLNYPHRGDSLLQCGKICANAFAHREVCLVGVALKLDRRSNEQRHHQQSNDG